MAKHSGECSCGFRCDHDHPEPIRHIEYGSLWSIQYERDASWIRDDSKFATRSDWSYRRDVDLSKHGDGPDFAKHRSDTESGIARVVVPSPGLLHTWFDTSRDTGHEWNERSFCRSACQSTHEHDASGDQWVSNGFAVQ